MKTKLLLSLVLIATGTAVGCGDSGPRRYDVTGVVTFEGQPIAEGEIRFSPFDGQSRPDSGRIINCDSKVKVTAGKKKIVISAASNDPKLVGERPKTAGVPMLDIPREYIPTRYNEESELSIEVLPKRGQSFPFALTKQVKNGKVESNQDN